jgi:hypothetical protein
MSHSAGMSFLTIASYIGVLARTLMMWTPGNAALHAASSHAAAAAEQGDELAARHSITSSAKM